LSAFSFYLYRSSSILSTSHICNFLFTHSDTTPDLHSFPTRRSSDLRLGPIAGANAMTSPNSPIEVPLLLTGKRRNNIVCISGIRSEEHTSELQSRFDLVCRLLLEKKNKKRCIEW